MKHLAKLVEEIVAPPNLGAKELVAAKTKLFDAAEVVQASLDARIEKLQAECDHDWKNMGGYDYLEDRCQKCDKSEWR